MRAGRYIYLPGLHFCDHFSSLNRRNLFFWCVYFAYAKNLSVPINSLASQLLYIGEFIMELRYAVFNAALKAKEPFSRKQRQDRMQFFITKMGIQGGERIIDLGGSAAFWGDCPLPLNLTIVNLPDALVKVNPNGHHNVNFVEGDACDLPLILDGSFDIAFSNSVIEHVGPIENQIAFAKEVQRVAPRFWVQTPSIWFPIEAHNHMPFWWAYPEPLKRKFISRWKQKLPAWTEMIEGTTVIKRKDLEKMFPTGNIWTERFAGFPKSYVIFS